jgi:hypothetical protein
MVALFPIPGAIAGKIQNVQKESMKRVSILPSQDFDVAVYFVARRTRVCRLLPKVKSQPQVRVFAGADHPHIQRWAFCE